MGVVLPRQVAYRVRQFAVAVAATVTPPSGADLAFAQSRLPASAWPLFAEMSSVDQRHSLQVLRRLEANGPVHPALCQAALLHDCAKAAAGVRLWHRVALVLLQAIRPDLIKNWQAKPPAAGNWAHVIRAELNHPQQGAEMAAQAGCEPAAALLIRYHHARPPVCIGDAVADELLPRFQQADDDA